MAIKPILFNTEMVRAILDGRKTQTRRIVKPQPKRPYIMEKTPNGRFYQVLETGEGTDFEFEPPYHPGDILYVRETWQQTESVGYIYRADRAEHGSAAYYNEHARLSGGWRPSIHMPKEAARIFLRVTDVRVETLCNMTISDLQKEGVLPAGYISQYAIMTSECFEQFKALWDSTIKLANISRYGWDANPWVWVIEFERCEKPEAV